MSTLTMDKDILLQCFLGIDVIENFDYMSQVNKTNWVYTSLYFFACKRDLYG